MEVQAVILVICIYALSWLLHFVMPGRVVTGYCCDNQGRALMYKLNGVIVFLLQCVGFRCWLTTPWQLILYDNFGSVVSTANAIGLLASLYFYCYSQVPGGVEPYERCLTVDQVHGDGRPKRGKGVNLVGKERKQSAGTVFFLGRDWNPRLLGVDVKMWLYLVGAVGLQCNILSCVAAQERSWDGQISIAMTTYTVAFAWFLIEYMLGEEVHLYTYDLFAEKIGFKLTWGCFVFYPCFYCIGAFPVAMASKGTDMTHLQAALTAGLFFTGWIITRGANLQKFYFRTQPQMKTFLFGLVKQECLPGTRILVSGWWGVARHLNYFGEIIQALALAVPGVLVGPGHYRWLALLYPLYYVCLFVPRQIDDDAVCAAKYGEAWQQYVKKVPYRIVPFVW